MARKRKVVVPEDSAAMVEELALEVQAVKKRYFSPALREHHFQNILDLYEISPEQWKSTPRISHILESSGVDPWPYLNGSEDPEARRLVASRRLLNPAQAEVAPIEAICLHAGVTPKKALAVIMSEVFEQSGKSAELLYAANHQGVVQATIDSAKTAFGASDRKLLLQHQGFAPVPKTNIVKIFGGQNVLGGAQTNQTAILAPMEDQARRLQDRFNEKLGLPEPAAQDPTILITGDEGEDGEPDEEEEDADELVIDPEEEEEDDGEDIFERDDEE